MGIPKNSETLDTQTDLKRYSLTATDIIVIDLTLVQFLFLFELNQKSVDFFANWLTLFENDLNDVELSTEIAKKLLT